MVSLDSLPGGVALSGLLRQPSGLATRATLLKVFEFLREEEVTIQIQIPGMKEKLDGSHQQSLAESVVVDIRCLRQCAMSWCKGFSRDSSRIDNPLFLRVFTLFVGPDSKLHTWLVDSKLGHSSS